MNGVALGRSFLLPRKGRSMRISAAILTGGKASRLGGIVKGLLVGAGNAPLIEHLIGELAIAGIHQVILSTNEAQPGANPWAASLQEKLPWLPAE